MPRVLRIFVSAFERLCESREGLRGARGFARVDGGGGGGGEL
jgi:hypothetical protein